MRKWNLPLTYEPKIQPVIDGRCTQTIRACTISKSKKNPGKIIRKEEGDLVRFYRWSGRPYWSSPVYITDYMPLVDVRNIVITSGGICYDPPDPHYWPWLNLDHIAELDFIDPPTGEALRDVLMSKNKIPKEGIDAQVLRWQP